MQIKALKCSLTLIGAVLFALPSMAEINQFSKHLKAAEAGSSDAQMKLGLAYEKGDGVPQDYAKAAMWYRRAACQGNIDAQIKLSEAYYLGRGVAQDFFLAGWWMLKVATKHAAIAEKKHREREAKAARGDANAQAQLRKATAQFMRLIEAAERGDDKAQHQLGLAYGLGEGISRDDAKSAMWHRRAAEQGHSESQLLLAISYAEGAGVPQDHVQALKWFNILLARAKGTDRQAIKIAIAFSAKAMTRRQILEAEKLARDWIPTREK